jgi:hypothetical protein
VGFLVSEDDPITADLLGGKFNFLQPCEENVGDTLVGDWST